MTRDRKVSAVVKGATGGRPRGIVPREYPRCVVRAQRKAGLRVEIHPIEGTTVSQAVAAGMAEGFRAAGYLRAVAWPWQGGSR